MVKGKEKESKRKEGWSWNAEEIDDYDGKLGGERERERKDKKREGEKGKGKGKGKGDK